ncbi:hypothetical protein [Curtobacterium sp. SL109]|uniref:hypothetical protein n=1 Tax=Curtobacterium sp. SL109 TaxID=2994662 RepID=UPI002274E5C7|nr:hypothetical protein [Curtobacterium sp. SL109]MCY1695595.1 hypothetical protein [Curtobacterium sp. SL109]
MPDHDDPGGGVEVDDPPVRVRPHCEPVEGHDDGYVGVDADIGLDRQVRRRELRFLLDTDAVTHQRSDGQQTHCAGGAGHRAVDDRDHTEEDCRSEDEEPDDRSAHALSPPQARTATGTGRSIRG